MSTEAPGYSVTPAMIQALDHQRSAEMIEAISKDEHYWVQTVMYRIVNPMSPDEHLLDAENLRGFIPIHCSLCGQDDITSTDPCLPVD